MTIGKHVRLVGKLHQRVGILPRHGQDAARPMIFERTRQHPLTFRRQRRSDHVPLITTIGPALERKPNRLRPIDQQPKPLPQPPAAGRGGDLEGLPAEPPAHSSWSSSQKSYSIRPRAGAVTCRSLGRGASTPLMVRPRAGAVTCWSLGRDAGAPRMVRPRAGAVTWLELRQRHYDGLAETPALIDGPAAGRGGLGWSFNRGAEAPQSLMVRMRSRTRAVTCRRFGGMPAIRFQRQS